LKSRGGYAAAMTTVVAALDPSVRRSAHTLSSGTTVLAVGGEARRPVEVQRETLATEPKQ